MNCIRLFFSFVVLCLAGAGLLPVWSTARAQFYPDGVPPSEAAGETYSVRVESPQDDTLIPLFVRNSLLVRLKDEPPDSRTGLELRLREDLELARRVMESNGYYDGVVESTIGQGSPPAILIVMRPGTRYTIGPSTVRRVEGSDATFGNVPRRLDDVGLNEGEPAIADNILDAVAQVREGFRENGYPYARMAASRYVLYRDTRTLNAEILIDPGEAVRMGDIVLEGNPPIWRRYFEAVQTWKKGQPWDQKAVEDYRLALSRGGLFQLVEIEPGETPDNEGDRPVLTEVTVAPLRTIGGSLRYDSDFGFGVQGFWEHRNITGKGDRLRLELPIWADYQKLTAAYRLPYFLRDDQNFLMEAALSNEELDAYSLRSASVAVGLERRLSQRWWGSTWVSFEVGQQKDPDESRHPYTLLGFPQTLRYDSTDDLLNATKGIRAALSLIPYVGSYDEEFTVLRSRFDLSGYQSLFGDDTVVLAARAAVGTIFGAKADIVPASVRFYSGGGGSVRGYDYQSIGPQNDRGKPLGGASFNEVSLETRWRWNETWGMVAFVDGGAVYESNRLKLGEDMQWGAGLGLRVYTLIGPIRFDVAAPLNKRDNDEDFQIYISIGQSF